MKTVATNNRSLLTAGFVLAALGALYFYRRQGGTASALLARGTDAVNTARGFINRVAPSVDSTADSGIASAAPAARASRKASKSFSAGARI